MLIFVNVFCSRSENDQLKSEITFVFKNENFLCLRVKHVRLVKKH